MSRKEKQLLDRALPGKPMPTGSPQRWRERELRRLRARLERHAFPRLEMFLLVGLTGAVGLFASWGLRVMGLAHMGWRYLLALGFAYVVFLSLLRLWMRVRPSEHLDLPDPGGAFNWPSGGGGSPGTLEGGGGEFGGGGASGSFDVDVDASDSVSEGLGSAALDGDGCFIPALLVILLGAIVFAALSVVWSAPALFAELALDGVLAAGLYRRLKHAPPAHWLETALRRTAWPFLATAVMVVGTGFVLQHLAPQADTLSAAIEAIQARD
jgi:hypothetical protein